MGNRKKKSTPGPRAKCDLPRLETIGPWAGCESVKATLVIGEGFNMFWLNSVQIPEEALERLWRRNGHIVPAELDDLVSFLENIHSGLKARVDSLRKDYSAYVKFCGLVQTTPEDPLVPVVKNAPEGLYGFSRSSNYNPSDDVLSDIPLTFSGLEKLRSAERTFNDTQRVINVLSKIRERFSNLDGSKDEEVRLFMSSNGKGLSFQLVYTIKASLGLKLEKTAVEKPVGADRVGRADVQKWIDFGLKAMAWKSKETDVAFQQAVGEG